VPPVFAARTVAGGAREKRLAMTPRTNFANTLLIAKYATIINLMLESLPPNSSKILYQSLFIGSIISPPPAKGWYFFERRRTYMNRNPSRWLFLIIPLLALAIWVDVSKQITLANPFKSGSYFVDRNVDIRLGLDLRGGLQALLEADVPADSTVSSSDLDVTKTILENRANALGVSEVVMQSAPPRRIVAEFPGVSNPDEVVAALQQTGLLEFVEMGTSPLNAGDTVVTQPCTVDTNGLAITPTPDASATATPEATATPDATSTGTTTTTPTVYCTVMTGAALDTVSVTQDTLGKYEIAFQLKSDSSQLFADYTGAHVNQYLAIVLDKKVISAPRIDSKIDQGRGVINGNFTQDSANTLAVQLRYGSLPVPVKVVESRSVGPTLGAESVRRSVIAGIIGLVIVILFMVLYYRLPGSIAAVALLLYALVSIMLFKLIPVVLTLPGIAGFILSIGMAVDANILIFERLKEELRAGRTLHQAIDLGWQRAWPSIRDSNLSTLITCLILFIFGNTFGASMVKGFSVTLALGVLVSLFTAIIVTRTFLHVVLDNIKTAEHPRWFGI
jgi:preprotein translocase subunit SecD